MGGRHTPGGISYYAGVAAWLEKQRELLSDGGREKAALGKGKGRTEEAGWGSGHTASDTDESVANVWNNGDERAEPRLAIPQEGDFRWTDLMKPDYVSDIEVLCKAVAELHRL